ncbi:MAG: DNA polymerase III subunit delta' [Desulfomonile tiedjei]|uniref:DNA polymerase III subunit delta' n=1 Tax=Desulfomonile tiedjei TaxID=2358 RepID=A0A9D6V0R0_9BACT|nr:DNA polymerase III subunit delta' [Desulfomonile tiedjei]
MNLLLGHDKLLLFLERTAREGRPAHAYLFSGREGVGKKLAALRFACLLNCPDKRNDPDDSCQVCRRIIQGAHPDVRVEEPEKGMIRIEKVRSLNRAFRFAPIEARYRVVIINDAHLMNLAAQNAMLKTLEEPPAFAVLILVSSRPSVLLPTVRSRCRRLRFGSLPTESVALILERKGISRSKALVLAAMSTGSAGRALEMEHGSFIGLRDKVLAAFSNPGATGIRGALELSAAVSVDRSTAIQAIDIACTWIRDVLIEQIGAEGMGKVHVDLLDRISEAAQHQSSEQLISVYEELVKAAELIEADINVNRNLVMDVTLLKALRIMAGPGLGVAIAGG